MKSLPGVPLLLGALGLLAIGGRVRTGSRAHLAALASSITPETPLYHGTRHDFETFVVGHPERKDEGWLGHGVYLTADPALAESYARIKKGPASPRVMEVRARLQNPYIAEEGDKKDVADRGHAGSAKATAELTRRGHDGVLLRLQNGSIEVVVFDPARVQHVATRVLPPIVRRKRSPKTLGARLYAALREDAAFQVLDADSELVGSDWGQGGCAVLASALVEVLGPAAQLHAVVHDGHVQHYVVLYEGFVLDGDGASTRATFRRRWNRYYGAQWARTGRDVRACRLVTVPRVEARVQDGKGHVVTFDGSCPAPVVAALVAHLRARLSELR